MVNHAIKEQELEDLTLTKCGNNVHTYLTTIQEKRNEINANLLDVEEYPACRFHTNVFTQLYKSTCDDFLTNVKDSKSRWIKSPDNFDQATEIRDLTGEHDALPICRVHRCGSPVNPTDRKSVV